MSNITLINDSEQEITTLEELMVYVLDYFDSSNYSSGDVENDFYNLINNEDILEMGEEITINSLLDGYKLLSIMEPNYWHIVRN